MNKPQLTPCHPRPHECEIHGQRAPDRAGTHQHTGRTQVLGVETPRDAGRPARTGVGTAGNPGSPRGRALGAGHHPRSRRPSLIAGANALVSLALFFYTRRENWNPRLILNLGLGLGYMILTALSLGVLLHWEATHRMLAPRRSN